MKTDIKDIFLSLVRLGIGNASAVRMPENIDWSALEDLAAQHGLSAVLVDGVERLPEGIRPPKPVLLQWIGETLQGYEYRYELYCRTIAEMAAFYNEHGFKMMVLKGYACSLDWPKPEHRPCGDIDIWLFGQQKEADEALAREKKIEVDSSHQHHTVFYWRDFMVENHYDFITVQHHKSNIEFERILKELGQDDTHAIALYGESAYIPSANLHALFLIKHQLMHFAAEGISLRQLLDWGFFVKAHGNEVDWSWLLSVLKDFGMMDAFVLLNAICVKELGFNTDLFPEEPYDSALKEKVLAEILSPEYGVDLPERLIPRVFYKIRRWKANEWKHKLCYKESMWSAFWSGVWNHLIKPSSI